MTQKDQRDIKNNLCVQKKVERLNLVVPEHQCKDCEERDLSKFYTYSYVRRSKLVLKPMTRCKLCLKIHRVQKSLANEQ